MTAKRQANKTNKPEYESDLPINEDYLSSSEKKAWKKNSGLYGFFFFFFFFFILIIANISFIFKSLSAVQIYDFHIHSRLKQTKLKR